MLSMLIDHAATHLQGTCYVSHTQSLRILDAGQGQFARGDCGHLLVGLEEDARGGKPVDGGKHVPLLQAWRPEGY